MDKPEPWMIEFVKGRHTQEEWDAFYLYMESGTFKRFLLQLGWLFREMFFGKRE